MQVVFYVDSESGMASAKAPCGTGYPQTGGQIEHIFSFNEPRVRVCRDVLYILDCVFAAASRCLFMASTSTCLCVLFAWLKAALLEVERKQETYTTDVRSCVQTGTLLFGIVLY